MDIYRELLVYDKLMSRYHQQVKQRYYDTEDIEKELKTVRAEDWENVKEFREPRGSKQYNLIHLASYTGRLEMLKQAKDLGIDLYIIDLDKRCALHYAAAQGHVDVVKYLVQFSTDLLQDSLKNSSGTMPLHLAVLNKHVEVVRVLVQDPCVDVMVCKDFTQTALHWAWIGVDRNDPGKMSRYKEIVNIILTSSSFKKFIDKSQDGMKSLVLNQAVLLNSITATEQLIEVGLDIPGDPKDLPDLILPLHIAASRGFHKMLCFLLKRNETSWMINTREELGNTPLHVAVNQRQWTCARTLIYNLVTGGDLIATNNAGNTVIDWLFRYHEHPIAFLTDILDTAVSEMVCPETGKVVSVVLDFKVLVPRDQPEMAVVSALQMANIPSSEKMYIFQHPLIEAFLALKWRRLRFFFFILLAFETSFVVYLVIYGTILVQTQRSSPGPAWILFVCACIQLCHHTLQLFTMPKYYVKQFEKWLSMISATICVIVVIAEQFHRIDSKGSVCSFDDCGQSYSWKIQSIGLAMLFACIQMTFVIGRIPTLGNYTLMFITVLKTALKVFLAVVLIIVGFSLSFSVLFHRRHPDFANPWKAFVKTVVMMTGDYDYSNLFTSTGQKNSSVDGLNSNESENTFLSFLSSSIFLAFVMLAGIVVMNLMTSLAVSDTQKLVNEALARRWLMQAEFLNHIEQVTSHWIFRSRLVPRNLGGWLTERNTIATPHSIGSLVKCENRPHGISEKLVKILYKLAEKNRNPPEESQTGSSSDSDERCEHKGYPNPDSIRKLDF